MARKAKSGGSLETEVIAAVVILYLVICGVMLGIHWMQPPGQETVTSSSSPSHAHFKSDGLTGAPAAAITLVDAHTLLTRDGYQEIRDLRVEGDDFVARAIKGGRMVDVVVDSQTRMITDRVVETH